MPAEGEKTASATSGDDPYHICLTVIDRLLYPRHFMWKY